MPTRRRLLLLGFTLLLGSIGVLGWVWNRGSPATALEHAKATLRAQGEPLELATFQTNIASAPSPLAKLVAAKKSFPDETLWPGSILTLQHDAQGVAYPASARPQVRLWGEETVSWGELRGDLDLAESGLVLCRQTFATPPASSGQVGFSSPYAYTVEWRRAAQWLQGAVLSSLHQRDLPQALTNWSSLLASMKVYQADLGLPKQLLRQVIGSMALATTWEALQSSGWTESQLVHIQASLDEMGWLAPLARSLEAHRAAGLDTFKAARADPRFVVDLVFAEKPLPPQLRGPLWSKLWADQDELHFLHGMQRLLDTARTGVTNRNWQKAVDKSVSEELDPKRYVLSLLLLPSVDTTLRAAWRLETASELARTAVAIARFQTKYGRAPNKLRQLTPEFLQERPIDWMNGQPLRYRVLGTGQWLLYSVGFNGLDEGGASGPGDREADQTFWGGPDLVWPPGAEAPGDKF